MGHRKMRCEGVLVWYLGFALPVAPGPNAFGVRSPARRDGRSDFRDTALVEILGETGGCASIEHPGNSGVQVVESCPQASSLQPFA